MTELSRLIATSCTITVRTICRGVAPLRASRARAPRRALSARFVAVPRTTRATRDVYTMLTPARTLNEAVLSPSTTMEASTRAGSTKAKFVATKARLTPSHVLRDPRSSARSRVLMLVPSL